MSNAQNFFGGLSEFLHITQKYDIVKKLSSNRVVSFFSDHYNKEDKNSLVFQPTKNNMLIGLEEDGRYESYVYLNKKECEELSSLFKELSELF